MSCTSVNACYNLMKAMLGIIALCFSYVSYFIIKLKCPKHIYKL